MHLFDTTLCSKRLAVTVLIPKEQMILPDPGIFN